MKKTLSFILALCFVLSMTVFMVGAESNVAKLGETPYATLQAALDACTAGDNTITLLGACAEDVTVSQVEGVNVTIDGANNEFSGTITIQGNNRHTGAETLTIKNIKFVTAETTHDFISSNSQNAPIRYAHNVTVDNCTFAGPEGNEGVVAFRFRQSYNIVVSNCEATNMHSLLWATGVSGLDIIGTDVTNSLNGISVATSTNVDIIECTIEATAEGGYGVRADATVVTTMTVEDCDITAARPIILRNATAAYNLDLEGNTLVSTGEGYQVVVTAGKDDEPFVESTANVTVNSAEPIITYHVVAKIEEALVNKADPEKIFITAELSKLNANNSIVVELYSRGTLLSTTYLVNAAYLGEETLTVSICLTGDSSSWDTYWEDNMLNSEFVPDEVVLIVDGVVMSSANVRMYATGGNYEDIVWADIVPYKNITCVSDSCGNVTVNDYCVMPGETVRVNVSPKYGWKLDYITVTDAEGNPVAVSGTSFVMPESNVTVSATYEEAYPVPEKIYFTASVDGAKAGECKFELSYDFNGENYVIEVAKNNAAGEINFAPVLFNGAGNYTYYIKQIAGDNASVEYDATVYTINVKVIYTADGELVSTVTGEAAEFTNVAK